MAIADSLNTIAENVPKVYEAGKKAKYDEFWDKYQDYGNRTAYGYAFGGRGWGWALAEFLPPKWDIELDSGKTTNHSIFNMFNGGADTRYDMTEICKKLDCSNALNLNGMFKDANVENINIDISNCTVASDMFNMGLGGGNIDKVTLKVSEKLQTVTNMFLNCKSIETLIFTEDSVIAVALNLSACGKLTHESLLSIINALKDYSGTTTTKTITFHATAKAKLTDAEKAIATQKGWNLA